MKVLGRVRPEGNQIQRAGERSGSVGPVTVATDAGLTSLRASPTAAAEADCASRREPPLTAEVLRKSRRFMPGIEPQNYTRAAPGISPVPLSLWLASGASTVDSRTINSSGIRMVFGSTS